MARTYNHKKLVNFSLIEWELLSYLAGGDDAMGVIRRALRTLAQQEPSFDIDAFAKHVTKHVLPKVDDQRHRDKVKAQLADLRRELAGELTPGAGPTLDGDIDADAVFGR